MPALPQPVPSSSMAERPPVKRLVVGSSPTSAASPGWCNGSTGDFESLSEGSKPSPGSDVPRGTGP